MADKSLYLELMDRCASLEEGHSRLKNLIVEWIEETSSARQGATISSGSYGIYNTNNLEPSWHYMPGYFSSGSPYQSILKCIGHAICVSSASTGKVIFWNRAAELLYGWEEHEVLGKSIMDIIIPYELLSTMRRIMERTCHGHTWSGQLPFKKRSSELFMGLTMNKPMYEGNELTGIITVSSDAAVYNRRNSGSNINNYNGANNNNLNHRNGQWRARPPVALPVTFSASTLASRLLLGNSSHNLPSQLQPVTGKKDENEILNYVNAGFSALQI